MDKKEHEIWQWLFETVEVVCPLCLKKIEPETDYAVVKAEDSNVSIVHDTVYIKGVNFLHAACFDEWYEAMEEECPEQDCPDDSD